MLLTITTTFRPATDLGYLLHKNPARCQEFRNWATAVAERFRYAVRFLPIGPETPTLGPPTQMGVFTRECA